MAKHIQRLFNVHAETHARGIEKEISENGPKKANSKQMAEKRPKNTYNGIEESSDIFSTQTKLQNNFFGCGLSSDKGRKKNK